MPETVRAGAAVEHFGADGKGSGSGVRQSAAVGCRIDLNPIAVETLGVGIQHEGDVLPDADRKWRSFAQSNVRVVLADVIAQVARSILETEVKVARVAAGPVLGDGRPDRPRIRPDPGRNREGRGGLRIVGDHDKVVQRSAAKTQCSTQASRHPLRAVSREIAEAASVAQPGGIRRDGSVRFVELPVAGQVVGELEFGDGASGEPDASGRREPAGVVEVGKNPIRAVRTVKWDEQAPEAVRGEEDVQAGSVIHTVRHVADLGREDRFELRDDGGAVRPH